MKKLLIILPLILMLSFMIGCQCNSDCESLKVQAELEKKNIDLVNNMWGEWNNRNLDKVTEVMSSDYVYFTPYGNPKGLSLEETNYFVNMMWSAFPDAKATIESTMADGDRVIQMLHMKGTHEGEFNGIPATGNKIDTGIIVVYRIEDGKIVEEWEAYDGMGFMMRLGFELQPMAK